MSAINELMCLKGRRALITGGAGSLGRVMAETLAELGANLILVDCQDTSLYALKTHLEEGWRVDVDCYVCDLEHQSERADLISSLNDRIKDLNILVNNAAFVGATDLDGWSVPFENQTIETWRRAIEVNLTAVFDLCQGLTPLLRSSVGANIINISSIYGILAPDWGLYKDVEMGNPAAYGVSKGGLIQLTRWLATTIAPDVRVNSISPGGILRGQPDVFVERYKSKTPLARMATEDDFRGVVAFLASDMARYVTGQNISVDGGWGIW